MTRRHRTLFVIDTLIAVTVMALLYLVGLSLYERGADERPTVPSEPTTTTTTTYPQATTTTTVIELTPLDVAGQRCYEITVEVPPEPGWTTDELVDLYAAGFALEGWILKEAEVQDCRKGVDLALLDLGLVADAP